MIFVDTSFLVGMLFAKDPHHAEAADLAGRHAADGWLTTNQVVDETWTYLRRRAGHGAAVAFLDAVDSSPRLHTTHVDAESEREAASWLRRHDEREYSFVDATSFVTMRWERTTTACSPSTTASPPPASLRCEADDSRPVANPHQCGYAPTPATPTLDFARRPVAACSNDREATRNAS